jgi:methyl-accepting chemotaxis protein
MLKIYKYILKLISLVLIKQKDIQTELREKRSNLEFIQQSAEELYVSTNSSEVSAQIRADVKSLRTRYQHLSDTIGERLTRLDKMIGELRSYQEEYASVANRLKTIESNLQIEHHTTAASSYGKTLEEQLGNLKQVKSDLDATTISVNRLNERAQKYVYSSNAETKFTAKMRQDVNEVNDKLNQLRENFSKKHYGLEVR